VQPGQQNGGAGTPPSASTGVEPALTNKSSSPTTIRIIFFFIIFLLFLVFAATNKSWSCLGSRLIPTAHEKTESHFEHVLPGGQYGGAGTPPLAKTGVELTVVNRNSPTIMRITLFFIIFLLFCLCRQGPQPEAAQEKA
jgi:preprotein translocase subunit SecG